MRTSEVSTRYSGKGCRGASSGTLKHGDATYVAGGVNGREKGPGNRREREAEGCTKVSRLSYGRS